MSDDVDCTIWPVMQWKFRNKALVCGKRNRRLEVSSRSMRSDVSWSVGKVWESGTETRTEMGRV